MAKSGGLGQGIIISGVDLSGDVGEVNEVGGGPSALDVTAINKSALERIGGLLDGRLNYTAFFDDAAGASHPTLAALPTGDIVVAYFMASTLGASCANIVAKQVDYAGTRGADGMLTYSVPNAANGFSLEWGDLATAGLRTDTTGTNGSALDGGAASSTGWSAYLQVTALTGTNVIVTLEDSSTGVSGWAAFTGSAFTSVTAVPGSERIAGAAGATVKQYVRAVTSGTFSSATFLVAFVRHPVGALA